MLLVSQGDMANREAVLCEEIHLHPIVRNLSFKTEILAFSRSCETDPCLNPQVVHI